MKLTTVIGLLLVFWLGSSCTPIPDFDAQLKPIVRPYRFSIARWESKAIPHEVSQLIPGKQEMTDNAIPLVTEYFAATERIKTLKSAIKAANAGNNELDLASLKTELSRLQQRKLALTSTVERIIEQQVRDALTEQGIFNPITKTRAGFPPVNFELEKPPHLLVISPRDRIESVREITLKPSLTLEEMADIEGRVDGLDVSSLVVELGGLGATYPTIVNDESGLRFTLETTAEEWLHQYLAFRPLGFRYLLDLTGLSRSYEIATMNETLAGMVSKELGAIIYRKYYAGDEIASNQDQAAGPESVFNSEMREIRKTVDAYLARGQIEAAEEFMEEKRQYLATRGYDIRKLNQAYFAFYGTYADKPAFLSPIGLELAELRTRSASLKDFLDTVAAMTSRQELSDSLK